MGKQLVKYEITFSPDQKHIEKKFWCVLDKGETTDETTMVYVYDRNNYALGEYWNAFKYFSRMN